MRVSMWEEVNLLPINNWNIDCLWELKEYAFFFSFLNPNRASQVQVI